MLHNNDNSSFVTRRLPAIIHFRSINDCMASRAKQFTAIRVFGIFYFSSKNNDFWWFSENAWKTMDFCSSRVAGGLVAPEAPEELERRRDRSVGRRRRPGGPETCRGMMLVMSRQVSGALGVPISILAKISKTVLFFVYNIQIHWYSKLLWEIHY